MGLLGWQLHVTTHPSVPLFLHLWAPLFTCVDSSFYMCGLSSYLYGLSWVPCAGKKNRILEIWRPKIDKGQTLWLKPNLTQIRPIPLQLIFNTYPTLNKKKVKSRFYFNLRSDLNPKMLHPDLAYLAGPVEFRLCPLQVAPLVMSGSIRKGRRQNGSGYYGDGPHLRPKRTLSSQYGLELKLGPRFKYLIKCNHV